MELKYQVLREGLQPPARAHPGDAGIDLRAAEDCLLEPGERAKIATGIAVEIPRGCAGLVLPRSGLADRHGIALVNSPGLIDAGYRGEVAVLLINLDPREAFAIRVGDRIAQLLLVRFEPAEPVESVGLSETERGAGGFGSSGVE